MIKMDFSNNSSYPLYRVNVYRIGWVAGWSSWQFLCIWIALIQKFSTINLVHPLLALSFWIWLRYSFPFVSRFWVTFFGLIFGVSKRSLNYTRAVFPQYWHPKQGELWQDLRLSLSKFSIAEQRFFVVTKETDMHASNVYTSKSFPERWPMLFKSYSLSKDWLSIYRLWQNTRRQGNRNEATFLWQKMSPMILFLTLPLCYWQEKALPILLVFLWTPAVSDLLINI